MSTKTEVKTEPKAETKPEVKETVVYIGPTIPGVASHNTFYNNGLPEGLIKAQENEPAFKGLVVPVEALTSALSAISKKAGATYVFYEKALNYKA